MKRVATWSVVVALALLVGANVLRPRDRRPYTRTTFGEMPAGYGALYDLFTEIGLPAMRLYDSPDTLPREATVWWIGPEEPCGGRHLQATWDARTWVEAGGTAVVLLPTFGGDTCALGPDLALPERQWRVPELRERTVRAAVDGTLVPSPRTLDRRAGVHVFRGAGEWSAVASAGNAPVVLERVLGAGRVAVVSDASIFSNADLDRADASVLAVDLVRRYGAPAIDERAWAPRMSGSAIAYLVSSPALGVFVGLLLLGVTIVWLGATLPPRRLASQVAKPIGLDGFVESLATLYARTRDFGGVLERYRALTLRRIRRELGLPLDTPTAAVLERLRRRGPVPAILRAETLTADEATLRSSVGALDSFVQEVIR